MGTRGPLRSRDSELQRDRSRKGSDVTLTTRGTHKKVTVPRVNQAWHPVVQNLYRSLKESGQSDFYQNSDWNFAYLLCDDLSAYKRDEDYRAEQIEKLRAWDATYAGVPADERKEYAQNHPRPSVPRGGSAVKLQTAYDGLARLMATEADRRRLAIELHAPEGPEAQDVEVISIADYRARLDMVEEAA
ncbi:hypothetical protein EDD28_0057 [Salana multivorans]|uniref:Terminase small subunit n=1 Tax=Salana multivorans TaxID=120377 RepID=A0A3N2D7T2_9MICO|nr:hypothetical protein [Salana multivorans]ROR95504.1 hypothetical protein EDD28_0057 [Salana multivorans]